MLVSIIMAVYNGEKYIDKAIKSILNQTLKDFEFIIIEDGSTDNSLKIIKQFAQKDNRLKLIKNNKNIGLTRSLNQAIKHSNGEFIARQDVDDFSLPNRLKIQIQFLKKNPDYAFCGCNGIQQQNKKNEIISFFDMEEIRENLIAENCFAHPSVVIKKSFLTKYGYFDERFFYGQDFELWCRLIYKFNLKAKNFKENLLIMNIPENRFLVRNNKKFLTQRINAIRTQLRYIKYSPYNLKVFISIVIRFIEILTLSHIMGYFIDFLKKIHC